jgi:hypothetical protein
MVWAGWRAKLKTSVVAFDLTQLFPSTNHDVLLSILDKQGFAPEVVVFFKSDLDDQFTHHAWDNDLSLEFPSIVGGLYTPPPIPIGFQLDYSDS